MGLGHIVPPRLCPSTLVVLAGVLPLLGSVSVHFPSAHATLFLGGNGACYLAFAALNRSTKQWWRASCMFLAHHTNMPISTMD